MLHTGQKQVVSIRPPAKFTLAGFPYHVFRGRLTIEQVPPQLGEHTREILAEAGYTDTEIDHLISSGAAQG